MNFRPEGSESTRNKFGIQLPSIGWGSFEYRIGEELGHTSFMPY